MTILTATPKAGHFLVSEANGTRSRKQVTIKAGEDLAAGTVMAMETNTGHYVALDPDDTVQDVNVARGILYDAVDATDGEKQGVIINCDAEVNAAELVWAGGDADDSDERAAAKAELEALGIKMR